MGIVRILACSLTVFLAGGCATLLRGKHQEVKFETEPAGAIVAVGGKSYTSPAVIKLERKPAYPVTVSMPGYQTIAFSLEAQWDALSLTNLPFPGGSAMFAYDTVTGADRRFARLAKITLLKSDDPTAPPLQLLNFRGRLLSRDEYDAAVEQARWDPESER